MEIRMELFLAVVAIVFTFCFIIAFHEFAHLVCAKIFDVKVLKYSIGFGRALFSKNIGETEYAIGWIPLGGYVKPLSEDELLQSGYQGDPRDVAGSLESKSRWKQMIIIAAGSIANLLLGTLLFFSLHYFLGFKEPTYKVSKVLQDSPAAVAGVLVGDEIRSVNGKAVGGWEDLTKKIKDSQGEILSLEILRNKKTLFVKVRPGLKEFGNIKLRYIGIEPVYIIKRSGFTESVRESVKLTTLLTVLQVKFFWQLAKNLVVRGKGDREKSRQRPSEEVMGPIGIFQLLYLAFKDGIRSFVLMAAVLNIGIGFMNLLPIYPIDGGRIFFLMIEMVLRRPVSRRVKMSAQTFGIAIFLLLMFWGTMSDLSRMAR
ncbi:MAG: site-2 protease family protein [Candidatus Harrisonbacteria bacterium]|nr:site-2 protease family protein [Candidatus Harrisonbacteria bacterium]